MTYSPSLVARGPTVIDIAASQHYPMGWCAAVKGGRITSDPGATHLTIRDRRAPAAGLRLGDSGRVPVLVSR